MKPEQIADFDAFDISAVARIGTAVTGTNTYRSQVTDLQGVKNPSYQLFWTGTPTGVFVVQGSNRAKRDDTTDADWTTPVPLDRPIVQPAGGASNDFVDLSGFPFRFVRIKYTNTSGTGNIFAPFHAKE